MLRKLTDFYFDGGEKNFILLNFFWGERWVKEKVNGQLIFREQDIKDAVNYILSNFYFKVGKKSLVKSLVYLRVLTLFHFLPTGFILL